MYEELPIEGKGKILGKNLTIEDVVIVAMHRSLSY